MSGTLFNTHVMKVAELLAAERNRARREALEEAANVRVPNTRFGGTNGLDVAEQEAIRALATRTEAPMAPEGKGTTK